MSGQPIDLFSPDSSDCNHLKINCANYDGKTTLVGGTVITISNKKFEWHKELDLGVLLEGLTANDDGMTIELFTSRTKAGLDYATALETITISYIGNKEYEIGSTAKKFNCWKLVITPASNPDASVTLNGAIEI